MDATSKTPGADGRRGFQDHAYLGALEQLYGTRRDRSKRLPTNWRDRLPDPSRYYPAHVEKLGHPNGEGWASARCPFHEDRNASFSVRLSGRGRWRCFADCGHGDMVTFHERVTGLPFVAAVRDLIGGAS